MNYIITEFSKYIMLLAIFSYVIESIWPLFTEKGYNNTGVYVRQLVYIFLIHSLSMVSLYIVTSDVQYLTLYVMQLIALFAVSRMTTMVYEKCNRMLLNHMCFLIVIGFTELSRLDIDKGVKHFFMIFISLFIFMFVPLLIKKCGFIKNYTVLIGTVGILMLILVFSLGKTVNGSKLTYQIFGFSFLPSEFVKILFVFFIAGILYENAKIGHVAIASVCAAAFVGVLAISRDLGGALIFYVAFMAVIFVATGKIWYSACGLIAGLGAACVGYRMFTHVQTRIATWIDPWSDIDATGYQLTQSLFAIGSGSWMGRGIGKGQPQTIPLVDGDFMFSAICEEYGVLFGIGIILVYLCLFVLLLKIVVEIQDKYYRLVVTGITTMLCTQTFLTIGGGTRLIPLTGVTLPLISRGGSSAMSCILMFGICIGAGLLDKKVKEPEFDEGFEGDYEEPEPEPEKPVPFENMARRRVAIPDDFSDETEVLAGRDLERALKMEILDDAMTREKKNPEPEKTEKPRNIRKKKTVSDTEKTFWSDHASVPTSVLMCFQIILFFMMIINIVKYMNFQRIEAISNDYNIVRQELMAAETIRGKILASDGTVLAETLVDANGNETRYYPFGDEYAHAVGYSTYGKTGVENYMNIYLINSNISFAARTENGVNGVKNPGDNVVTTLIPEIQDVARSSLGVYKGAIIVTKADTGEILAMCSTPSFDPNTISSNFAEVSEDTVNSVLVNRVSQGRYQPGSTFKVVTLLEYMRENPTTYKNYSYTCNGYIKVGQTTIHCFRNNVHGYEDLYSSLGNSCNSSFGNIALSLDRLAFADTLSGLMFNTTLPVDFPANQSSASCQVYMDDDELVQTAIGQGKVLMTPLHLNMITQAIANGGVMMKPYLVSGVVNAEGGEVESYSPISLGSVMTEAEATDLMTYLRYDVTNGTARKLGGQVYTAAGKTGSAEYSDATSASHAWFTGYAPAEKPEIVVTIILEGAGTGGDYCVPIARRLFAKYFELNGEFQ